jgi:intraflagellar transport protein 81
MEKIALIVQKLNGPPFNKRISTMSELDSKTSLELLDLMCEIVCAIDPEQEDIYKEATEARVRRIIQFLVVMKFNIPEEQMDDFTNLLLEGDKEMLQTIMHWCLQKFEHLQKRAYLARFLMPVEIPAEFFNDDLIAELSQRLKELQTDFKEVHKAADQSRSSGAKPAELKAEIAQLEQEKTHLQNKIQKMKKDMNVDEEYFREMLKVGRLAQFTCYYIPYNILCSPQGDERTAQRTGERSDDSRART